ncbi:hypothetical protein [Bradyrhizobium sp. CCGB20]|uniref:hypothetical protein n=1 Tax=Bradyrhizobium sp. CCGB20 TaxID=2949633 RepID=UPI0020B331D5|nr:hypothetical protein [Bradyrhizobium sp. CCGB20]MCP3399194.1 hypothetical protein [Bradyrhizobium sp. CCGB20]
MQQKWRGLPPGETEPTIWPFFMIVFGVPIVAVVSGYFLATIFLGSALAVVAMVVYKREKTAVDVAGALMGAVALASIGGLFIMPWGANDHGSARQDTAYSCQPEHYDRENCEAQRRGISALGQFVNEFNSSAEFRSEIKRRVDR